MTVTYDSDVVAWAREQAALLRERKFSQLDIEHIADEVEDVGKSEQRELASRMAVLIAHLLKWRAQPERQSRSWTSTIGNQRERIALALKATPSLKASLRNEDWWREAWLDALARASQETGIDEAEFGETCPWTVDEVLDAGFLPGR